LKGCRDGLVCFFGLFGFAVLYVIGKGMLEAAFFEAFEKELDRKNQILVILYLLAC
jgi:hypothetical protein